MCPNTEEKCPQETSCYLCTVCSVVWPSHTLSFDAVWCWVHQDVYNSHI